MNQEKHVRKVIMMSLAGLLIGSLLFIFGASLKDSLWPMIVNYIIAMLLFISSFLAVYNNNQKNSQPLYKYIMFLTIGLAIIVSITMFSHFM